MCIRDRYNGEHATSVNGTGHPTVEDMITYEGQDVNELRKDFEGAIDDLSPIHIFFGL